MKPSKLRLLREFLEQFPHMKRVIRLDPPRLRARGGWHRIHEFEMVSKGLRIRCSKRLTVLLKFSPLFGQRRRFLQRVSWLLRMRLPGWRIEELRFGTSRVHAQTSSLVRILLSRNRRWKAILAVCDEDPPVKTVRVLTGMTLWWDRISGRNKWLDLVVLASREIAEPLLRVVRYLEIDLRLYALPEAKRRVRGLKRLYPRSSESSALLLADKIYPFEAVVPPEFRDAVQKLEFLDLVFRRRRWELSFRGLCVAWSDGREGPCYWNLRDPRSLAEGDDEPPAGFLDELLHYRRFPPPDPHHELYRLGQEHWLESLILKNLPALHPELSSEAYCQVPTCLDGDRGLLDVLTVTEKGRLAVIEIKVQKDLNLLFQGLEYWSRVYEHLKRGDLQRAGYFPGTTLSDQPPLLLLVAPLFEFHRSYRIIERYLVDVAEIYGVGLNSDWRADWKVLKRFRIRGGKGKN